jgi:hypothetical protein
MVTGLDESLAMGTGFPVRVMVPRTPEAKLMVSLCPLVLEMPMASLSEQSLLQTPSKVSAVLVTVRVAALAGEAASATIATTIAASTIIPYHLPDSFPTIPCLSL